MNDHDINKALALAIGWKPTQLSESTGFLGPVLYCCVAVATLKTQAVWRLFDYRDPTIIWPIAERHRMFPTWDTTYGQWTVCAAVPRGVMASPIFADTAAQAVALAVIRFTP